MTTSIRAAVILLACTFFLSAGWFARGIVAQRDTAILHQKFENERVENERAANKHAAHVMERSMDLSNKAEKERLDGQAQIEALNATRRNLAAESGRLRDHVIRLAASTSAAPGDHPASAVGSSPASGPGLVLTNLWGSAEEEAVELGPALDDARARGLRCERLYEDTRQAINSLRAAP